MNELDDLGNLFEFGDIDLNNIPDVDSAQYGDQMQQSQSQHGTHPNTPFHDLGDPSLLPASAVGDFAGQDPMDLMQGMDQQAHFLGQPANQMSSSNSYLPEAMYQSTVPQSQQPKDFHFHGQQQHYPPSAHIPPTPNSYEMHGRAANFINQQPQQQQQFYRATMEQQRYQMQKDAQIAFTPMASPAVTPQYHILPEFTTPGAYFSPLSSPMIHAQNSQHHGHAHPQAFLSHPTTAPSSAAPSPNEGNADIEMGGNGTAGQEIPSRRKSKKKIATPKSAASTGKAKPSPAQKAQKRKPSTKASETDLRRAVTSQPSSASLRQPDSSEAESISPEPLSESVMGPPPRPGSTLAQAISSSEQQGSVGAAATPKSLLQRRGTQQLANGQASTTQTAQSTGELGGLDDLALPEAARPPAPAPINTQLAAADEEGDTPRISARKTPKLGATDTPSSARPSSTLPSPTIAPSPATASTPAGILKDKKDAKGGRGSKKRGSISQSNSKNLPRISPSIKPLLPEGSPLHSSTQALLLASKSNYQNLLEGNHLPGVNYPDSLSTGLTSKRTSHKVAEQGRRNRINEALKEMQSLVPKPSPATKAAMKEAAEENGGGSPADGGAEGGDGDAGGAKSSSNSKAATVELANEYIRRLQRDWAVRDAEMEVLRRENEVLRMRLGEGEVGAEAARDEDGMEKWECQVEVGAED